LTDASGQRLLIATFWTLSGKNYVRATTLEPGKGYWIYSRQALTLSVSPPATATASAVRQTLASREWNDRVESLSEWMADITNPKRRSRR
jgi:hypothetical protein